MNDPRNTEVRARVLGYRNKQVRPKDEAQRREWDDELATCETDVAENRKKRERRRES